APAGRSGHLRFDELCGDRSLPRNRHPLGPWRVAVVHHMDDYLLLFETDSRRGSSGRSRRTGSAPVARADVVSCQAVGPYSSLGGQAIRLAGGQSRLTLAGAKHNTSESTGNITSRMRKRII